MRITSSEGSSIRTYLAAVAPPQPPPITITRRPEVGARSAGVVIAVGAAVLAQPARPETAMAAPLDALRKSLRLIRAMTSPWNCHGRWTATVRYSGSVRYGEFSRVLVPRRRERPRGRDRDHEQHRRTPADGRRQEHRDAELAQRAAERQSRGGGAQGEAHDGGPELHLSLAGAPDRARAAAAGHGHAGERLAARSATRPRPRPSPAARPVRAPRGLPEQIAQAEKGADAEAEHHREAGEAQGTHRGEEAADVAAAGERGAHAHEHAAGRALDQLAARGHADRELARAQRARRAAEQ